MSVSDTLNIEISAAGVNAIRAMQKDRSFRELSPSCMVDKTSTKPPDR